jgi:hypothetical protein
MIRVASHPCGRRVYVLGRRVHHGSAGCAIAAIGVATHHRALAALGAALALHDARDFPFRDCDNHGSSGA